MLTLINLMFFMILFIFSLMVFVSSRKHLLVTLISLEFIVLVMYLFLYNFLSLMNYEYYFSMVFLTFSVCEGTLGLSILVSLIRTYGTDYFQTYNILQC
uniref:NADH-ubiquinone oxidoreductase chain 4L n=1 Tax=Forcipomyia makanensis TaxID=2590746 RepID=A0A513X8V7_9DIPT|nr:NADH dehydrogenase subunit 4L [Forcipomyia makanensis]